LSMFKCLNTLFKNEIIDFISECTMYTVQCIHILPNNIESSDLNKV